MSTGAGYDSTVTSYSPDGRVFQIEYAEKAVEKGATVLGIKCVDGVVLVAERIQTSRLLVTTAADAVLPCDAHCALAFAGIGPDGRALLNKARDEAREYKSFYGAPIPGRVLSQRVASRAHAATIYWSERPFGAAALIAAHDAEDGATLHVVSPVGTSVKHHAAAVGRGRQAARGELERLPLSSLTCRQAVAACAAILHKLHDDVKDKPFTVEAAWIRADDGFKVTAVPEAVLAPAVAAAKEAKRRALMDDSDDDE